MNALDADGVGGLRGWVGVKGQLTQYIGAKACFWLIYCSYLMRFHLIADNFG